MSKAIAMAIAIACAAGCTGTRVKVGPDGTWTVCRLSILQKTDVPSIKVDGVGSIAGYSNDGGNAAIGAAVQAAIAAGLKGVAP